MFDMFWIRSSPRPDSKQQAARFSSTEPVFEPVCFEPVDVAECKVAEARRLAAETGRDAEAPITRTDGGAAIDSSARC